MPMLITPALRLASLLLYHADYRFAAAATMLMPADADVFATSLRRYAAAHTLRLLFRHVACQ